MNGSKTLVEGNEWIFTRDSSRPPSNAMIMSNLSRTDMVTKYLMYSNTGSGCGVVKVETITPVDYPLLAQEINEETTKNYNGDFTVRIYVDLVVKNPKEPVPSDCNAKYAEYVKAGNTTIYTSDCDTSGPSSG